MKADEAQAVNVLSRCSMMVGCNDKRFVRSLKEIGLMKPEQALTEAQRKYLFDLVHKYRRQHNICQCGDCKSTMIFHKGSSQ